MSIQAPTSIVGKPPIHLRVPSRHDAAETFSSGGPLTFVATTDESSHVPGASVDAPMSITTLGDVGRVRPAQLHRIVSSDTYVLLIAASARAGFDEGATTLRVKLADYAPPQGHSIDEIDAHEAVESLLNSGPLSVALHHREIDGNHVVSLWAGVTPVAPALAVMGHSRAMAPV